MAIARLMTQAPAGSSSRTLRGRIMTRTPRSAAAVRSAAGTLRNAAQHSCGILAFALASFVPSAGSGQRYDPLQAFAPFTMPQPVSPQRGASGVPGAGYWQNRADYKIHVTLDPVAKTIAGTATINYTNNSPDVLDVLWLQLDQNLYRAGSRGASAQGGKQAGTTEGMILDDVRVSSVGGTQTAATPLVSDTRAQIRLKAPLAPKATATIAIRYHYVIPRDWGGRTSWGPSPGGDIYDIAQWYPRMAVYDELRGWDTAPYLSQEFYLDYGDFDYWITLPADMLVAGSGELLNPNEVLSTAERARLAEARLSDATVMIRSPADAASGRPMGRTKTWHWRMTNTRDVAFAASRAFVWDASRIRLPGGRTALAQSVYPAESKGDGKWGRSTEYLKDAVERFSAKWGPYPWANATNVAGPTSGMEYPGIVFDGPDDAGKVLFWITVHEIGHSWFPMLVGFDERRDAWMDEGFNTFIDVYESDDFDHGAYGPKRDPEFAPGGGNPVDEIVPVLADPAAPPLLARADTVVERWRHPITYFKSALGLKLLREEILGPDRFDHAFRRFIAAWAFRHPKPSDFFRAMESDAGEDLSWWWRGWYQNNWQLDLAVAGLESTADGTPLARVEARDRLVMPATLRATYSDGRVVDVRLPAETWIRQAFTQVALPKGVVSKVEVDPDHRIPDRDRGNNVFPR